MLSQILSAVRQWLQRVAIPAQVLTDRDDGLRVIFETENALAELIVGAADCGPYRHVAFTVLDTRLELTSGPVFCFYDTEADTLGDILRALDRGAGHIASM